MFHLNCTADCSACASELNYFGACMETAPGTFAYLAYNNCTAGLAPLPASDELVFVLYTARTTCALGSGQAVYNNLGSTGSCVPFFDGKFARATQDSLGIVVAELFCADDTCSSCDIPTTMVASCQELGPTASWTVLPGAKLTSCQ